MSALALRPADVEAPEHHEPEPPALHTHDSVTLLEQRAWDSLRRRDPMTALDELERAIGVARRFGDRRAVARISLLASDVAARAGQELLARYYADESTFVLHPA